jgi:protoporphyrinogen oxidase
MENKKVGVIIGAGPAGLSAAETLSKSDVRFTVLEACDHIGGLSATVKHNDFYFDIGAHRFFTKNPEIDKYVTTLLGDEQLYVNRTSKMLLKGKLLHYPLKPLNALVGLGVPAVTAILFGYIIERLKFKHQAPESLEDVIISQFGAPLYKFFFKMYTEKVCGIECSRISAQWGAQRIKGLSLRTAIIDALWENRKKEAVTWVKQFAYPRKGFGVICDKIAEAIKEPNCLLSNARATEIFHNGERITAVAYSGKRGEGKIACDFVISSMPITELVTSLRPAPPDETLEAARGLKYRGLVCVALMFDTPSVTDQTWIYIHDTLIDFGRIHEPKNWSRDMAPADKTCVVFEYFCNEGDAVWNAPDEELFERTKRALKKSHIAPHADDKVFDYKVVRAAKAYPSYEIGFSDRLLKIRDYLKRFENLQLIGRFGTYKYNNLDHSVETGIMGAQNVLGANHDTFEVDAHIID